MPLCITHNQLHRVQNKRQFLVLRRSTFIYVCGRLRKIGIFAILRMNSLVFLTGNHRVYTSGCYSNKQHNDVK